MLLKFSFWPAGSSWQRTPNKLYKAENADAQTPPLMATPSEPLRVVEFFAGIGGLHYALQRSGVPHRVVQAFDVDDSAVRPHGKSERGGSSASVSRRRL